MMLQDSHEKKLEMIEAAQIEQTRLAERKLHQQNEAAKTALIAAEMLAVAELAVAREHAENELARLEAANQLAQEKTKADMMQERDTLQRELTKKREDLKQVIIRQQAESQEEMQKLIDSFEIEVEHDRQEQTRVAAEYSTKISDQTRKLTQEQQLWRDNAKQKLEHQMSAKVARLHEIQTQHAHTMSTLRASLDKTMLAMQEEDKLTAEVLMRENTETLQKEEEENREERRGKEGKMGGRR